MRIFLIAALLASVAAPALAARPNDDDHSERRHERIARDSLGSVWLIRKRTMHHAETSLASFRRLADVAVLAL